MPNQPERKKKTWPCVLCGYKHESADHSVTCPWVHIFKKDKYYLKLKLKK